MRARIVGQRYHHRAAVVAGVVGMTGAAIASMAFGRTPLGGLGFLLASFAPFLFREAKTRPAGDAVDRIRPENVRKLSVARASLGWSVAIGLERGEVLFVELEGRSDARRLVRRLRAGRKDVEGITVEGELPWAPAAHALAGAIALAVTVQHLAGRPSAGAFFMATIVTLLTFVRVHVTSPDPRGLFLLKNPFDAHAWLHLRGERVPLEGFERETDGAGAVFARGEHSAREWLARIDELAAPAGGAYRDSVDEPTLRALVADEGADIDRRMAAARILKKRIGVSLADEVEDIDVRARIEAAVSDEEDAATRIDELEPLFRSRSQS